MSFWPAFCHAHNKPLLIDWLIEDVQHTMKFNILHYVLLLSSIRYPSSSDFLSSRGSSNSFSSSIQFSLYIHLHSVLSLHICSTKYMICQLTSNCNWPWNAVSLTCIHRQQVLIIPWGNNFATNRYGNALFYFSSKRRKVSCRGIIQLLSR